MQLYRAHAPRKKGRWRAEVATRKWGALGWQTIELSVNLAWQWALWVNSSLSFHRSHCHPDSFNVSLVYTNLPTTCHLDLYCTRTRPPPRPQRPTKRQLTESRLRWLKVPSISPNPSTVLKPFRVNGKANPSRSSEDNATQGSIAHSPFG